MKKDADGSFEAFETSDLDDAEIGELRGYETELAMLLSEQDVTDLAETIEPGSSAALLVWENLWAAPFGAAVRHAGGQLAASGRIPIQAVIAAVEAAPRNRKEPDMPLAARRRRRTVAAVGGAVVVAHGINRRHDRRDNRGDRRDDRRDR